MMPKKLTKKATNIPLTRDEQHEIRALIRTWKKKFTWDLLVEAALSEKEIEITRQALSNRKKYKTINNDYHDKKAELRGVTPKIVKTITMSGVALSEKVDQLNALVDIKNEQIEKQFAIILRMLANAQEIPNYDLPNIMKPQPKAANHDENKLTDLTR
jgi:phage terminase large subunit GpA-like protein